MLKQLYLMMGDYTYGAKKELPVSAGGALEIRIPGLQSCVGLVLETDTHYAVAHLDADQCANQTFERLLATLESSESKVKINVFRDCDGAPGHEIYSNIRAKLQECERNKGYEVIETLSRKTKNSPDTTAHIFIQIHQNGAKNKKFRQLGQDYDMELMHTTRNMYNAFSPEENRRFFERNQLNPRLITKMNFVDPNTSTPYVKVTQDKIPMPNATVNITPGTTSSNGIFSKTGQQSNTENASPRTTYKG